MQLPKHSISKDKQDLKKSGLSVPYQQLVKSENIKRIRKFKDLKVDEAYLIFVGYSTTPSGFNIGILNLSGWFDMQGYLPMEWTSDMIIYELPKIAI
jgi:hypothetical protein